MLCTCRPPLPLSKAHGAEPGWRVGLPRAGSCVLTVSPSALACVLAFGHQEAPSSPCPFPPPDLEPASSPGALVPLSSPGCQVLTAAVLSWRLGQRTGRETWMRLTHAETSSSPSPWAPSVPHGWNPESPRQDTHWVISGGTAPRRWQGQTKQSSQCPQAVSHDR